MKKTSIIKIGILIQIIGIIYGLANKAYDVLVVAIIFLLIAINELFNKSK
tara:strand:- start:128 stop:277 length:150 start_codon:yes stop_codon:yes gene_type:complete